MDEHTITRKAWYPTPEEQKARHVLYSRLQYMRELKDEAMPHFADQYGHRSFNQYLDDSERIINGYILSRESQDKEAWQSNTLDNVTRAKLRGIATSVGLTVPDMLCEARNEAGLHSPIRADFSKNIAKQTFEDGNPSMHNFLVVWHLLSHGIAIEYDGYQTGGAKIKRVKSFDSRTGDVETETLYVEGKGKPYSVLINPQEFFWWDMHVRDVQEQPHVAWVQHYTKRELELEFSKFPNYHHVRDRAEVQNLENLQKTLYFDRWKDHVAEEDDYEVIRFYSLENDIYEIWCNGVPLLRAPMLWGHEEKYYPFAKAIAEPFANTNFFAGMSLAGILESMVDTRSTVINTMIDKLYRSMDFQMLIGLENKDLFDVEETFNGGDGKYYVPNVDSVKPMPVNGIDAGELAFLQVIDRGIESLSIDRAQQGLEGTGQRTLGEAQIADERARELKGMLYLFLEDFWFQKYKLRNRTILTHYLKDKALRKNVRDNIVTIQNYQFADGTTGILDIHIAKSKDKLLSLADIEAREMAAQEMGLVYKLVSIPVDYMDDWHLSYRIIPGSFHNQDRIRKEGEFDSEVQWAATLYPEFFAANRDKYLSEKLSFRGKHIEDFNPPVQPPPLPAPGEPADPNAPAPAPTEEPSILGLQ